MVLIFLIFGVWINLRINHDTTTNVQNECQIVVNPLNGNNLVAIWRDFRLGYRRVGVGYSLDGGRTWNDQLFEGTPYTRDSDPGLTVGKDGTFYAVILAFESTSQPNGLFVYRSTDNGVSWDGPYTVIDQVPGVFEDKELIACDRTNSPYQGNLYVPWTRFGATTQIMCARSTDGGFSFESPVRVSDQSGVQWPVPAVGPDGTLYIAWDAYNAIKIDKSTDGGVSFGSDRVIQYVDFGYGYINGGILVFSFPAIDVDITGGPNNGTIYCVYSDYSPAQTDLDIYFTKSTDGGLTWSAKKRINDDALNNGCDQFHPWLTVDRDGRIVVVFLDRRLDPNNYLYDCFITYSTDGGATWAKNERISTVSSDPNAGKAGLLGEYIGVASFDGDIHPAWVDTREGNQDCYTAYWDVGVEERPKKRMVRSPATIVTKFRFSFGHPSDVRIYDVSGRLVKSFTGVTKINWDGGSLPSGVYLVKIESHGKSSGRKVVFIR
ncbi:hypothetical protein DRP53_08910 [candidate division WOR-3 bacterium]|uniref:T9SS type A sorting domain-containing protein n=1 Tax=candidate division WOR-3 bacterium TaxID=2052148 RepID=A0A660SEJ1_UNCW3|nr:MAG: hypothetical protein DRP53_08910 [candidate division WOR-3 bacterium]